MTTSPVLPEPLPVETVGVVGWGRMGAPMGQALLDRGWPVVGTDPSETAGLAMAAAGARALPTPAAVAAQAELVLLVVVDDAQVDEVLVGPQGVLAGARPGTIVAICASVRPGTCRTAAEQAAGQGVHVIDVGLSGGERGAKQAGLRLFCGGPEPVIAAAAKAFSAFAIDVCSVGELGAGQAAKSVNNLLLWACLRADVEALRLGEALGLAPGKLRAFLNIGSGANRPLTLWGSQTMRWAKKDLEVSLALAEEAGLDLGLMRALPPLMDELSVADLERLR